MRYAVRLVLATMLAGACGARSAAPPEIVVDRTACHHCGMLISDRRYAAALRTPEGDRVFDDIGCLVNAMKGRAADRATFWFHDAVSGDWIDGAPVFVSSAAFRTPMAGGVLAYRDRAAADRAAAAHQGVVIASIDAVLARAGGER